MHIEISVFLDGKSFYCERLIGDTSSQRIVMVGRKFARANINDNKPFVGLMETLAICADDITLREFSRVAEKLDCISKSSKYDEFGLYKGLEISKSGTHILSSEVDYKSLDKTENGKAFKQLSHIVSEERISASGESLTTRTYTTDKLGRVTGIADSKFGNHSYEYDFRGFLVKDGNTAYEYDANGNVTKIGNTVLEYDSVVKDKLVKVGGKVVAYDANNPLVPTSYDGNTYTFEGRRLARIQKGGKVIDYTYNDQGLRIKKTITENGTSLETRFFYDGTKLIAEISPTHRLDFLYDENDRLYGFVMDKTATYFYVRDTLENVLGIVDSTGNLVVQYAYNAWGKIQSITGTLATTVGACNPFRYKGYHFDSDTGMYYCHTRYYVPDWCRWLCADSIAYIRYDSFNQMNLFAYCGNNPISFSDASGKKLSKKGAWILFGVLTAISLVTSILTLGTTSAVLGVIHSVATGFLIGSQLNVVKQTIETNGDMESIDPFEALTAGAIGTVVGGTSKIFSTCFQFMGEMAGLQIGTKIGSVIKMAPIFGKIGNAIGHISGAFIGGVIGNELGSNMVGVFPGIREDAHASGSDMVWQKIGDIIKRLVHSL